MSKFDGLSGVYSTSVLQEVANGLIKLFVPIYIYTLSQNLMPIFIFQLIFRFSLMAATYPTTKLIKIFGPDKIMFVSNFFQIGYFSLLILAKLNPSLVYLSALLSGIAISFFWIPYHLSFSSLGDKEKFPKQIAKMQTLTKIASVTTPLIGGLIAERIGFNFLLFLGSFILVLSSGPMMLDNYNQKTDILPFFQILKKIFYSAEKKLYIAYFFDGFRISIDNNFWPIVLFSIIPNLDKIGGLKTISLLLFLIITNLLGHSLSRFHLSSFIGGNTARSFLWTIRGLNFSPLITIITEPAYKIASIFYKLPQKTLTYELGKKRLANFFTAREWSIGSGIITADILALSIILSKLPDLSISAIAILGITLSSVFMSAYIKERQ